MKYQAVIETVQKLEISILAVISKIYSHINLSQNNKIKLTAFNVATFLITWEGGEPTRVSTKSCWKHWVVSMWEMSCRDPRNWLSLLQRLGRIRWTDVWRQIVLFFKIWKIELIVWNFWDLDFFRIMINFSDLTFISHVLISLWLVGCFWYYKIIFWYVFNIQFSQPI